MTAPGRHRIADQPIGRRIAQLRARRGLTQQVFADRIGKSHSWVDKVERGIRSLDRISVVHTVAAVLGVTPETILGPTTSRPEPATDTTTAAVEHLRAALARYDTPTPDQPAPPVEDLHRRIQYAWTAYQHAHYPQLLRMLPDLLTHTRHATTSDAPRSDAVGYLLTSVYRLTAHLLTKLDEPHLAWLAADRAIATAAGHPRHTAAAAIALTQALRALHRPTLATRAALTAVPLIDPATTNDAAPDDHALAGTLLIEAALAAATGNDPATAHDLSERADRHAASISHHQRRPDHGDTTTAFGPTAVALARAHLAAALGDPHQAITHHQHTTASHGWRELPAEHRAAHLIDITRAYLDTGNPTAAAARAIITADQIAPAETRTRPTAHTVVATLLRTAPTPDLTRLATTIGLTPRP
ncbi:transcriptional regulator with XRE-family HTH domain [Micromonospora sp. Llam0]|uniref:helix-turn-helix domain-containing protein n=1 Tax=Micromonospora sp. Llam0 TaxID=2485143 RepID=UPI000F485A83|nr:helix-turn-helix domain-containing protein [Micromonospora sp. Llam0]ROO62607.1 transcriptional regulator with XRE-family HTH domain [Micromonospora sp. Llam0]